MLADGYYPISIEKIRVKEISIKNHKYYFFNEMINIKNLDLEKKWRKIKDLIRSINNNSDDYEVKYMKIKFSSNDDLPLKRTLELHKIIIVVRFVFHEDRKYDPQIFLHEHLYKLAE